MAKRKPKTRFARLPVWAISIISYGYSDTESDEDCALALEWAEEVGFVAFGHMTHPQFHGHNDITSEGCDCVDVAYLGTAKEEPYTYAPTFLPTKFICRVYPNGEKTILYCDGTEGKYCSKWGIYSTRYFWQRHEVVPGSQKWKDIFKDTRAATPEEDEWAREELSHYGDYGQFNPQPIKKPGRWRS